MLILLFLNSEMGFQRHTHRHAHTINDSWYYCLFWRKLSQESKHTYFLLNFLENSNVIKAQWWTLCFYNLWGGMNVSEYRCYNICPDQTADTASELWKEPWKKHSKADANIHRHFAWILAGYASYIARHHLEGVEWDCATTSWGRERTGTPGILVTTTDTICLPKPKLKPARPRNAYFRKSKLKL